MFWFFIYHFKIECLFKSQSSENTSVSANLKVLKIQMSCKIANFWRLKYKFKKFLTPLCLKLYDVNWVPSHHIVACVVHGSIFKGDRAFTCLHISKSAQCNKICIMTKIAEQRSHTFGRKTFAKWGEKLFEFIFLSSEICDFTRHLYFQKCEICRDICIFWILLIEETFNLEMVNENSKIEFHHILLGEKLFAKTAHMGISSWKTTKRKHEIVQFCFLYTQDFWIWEIHTVLLTTIIWSRVVSKLTISPRCIHHWPSTMLQQCLPWHPITV